MKHRRLFLLLTLLILVSDLLFVGINQYASQRTLRLSLQRSGDNLKHAYDLTLSLVYENMLQLSTYIANQTQVQQLFLAGKRAVAEEGGGAGGERAAQLRAALYANVSPGWLPLMEQYDARQLHFHLGPGSLSFLRVHRPESFGDRMEGIRHIIVDSYRDREPKTGFEVGRIYAGLRGVSPVWADNGSGERELVGVLEVGTSFQTVLAKIQQQTGVEMMVLLNQDLVHATLWPESIGKRIVRLSDQASCYVEALSAPKLAEIVESCERFEPYKNPLYTRRQEHDGRHYAVTHFPLYDYRSGARGDDRQAGMVVMLADITDEIAAHRQQLQVNLVYALVGFVVVEVLLYLGIVYGSRALRLLVSEQTAEIHRLKEYYKSRSERDGLTGLYNHRFINERLQQELHRSARSGTPLCLLMCDLDDFKAINDGYGHLAGDRVLATIASVISELIRASDCAGRYGGEEFILALVDTPLPEAVQAGRRLVERVATLPWSDLPQLRVTLSIGVAAWDGRAKLPAFIRAADEALYEAKRKGKNRVECGS